MSIRLKTKGSMGKVTIEGQLGEVIYHTRIGLGLTRTELSRMSGVAQGTIKRTEECRNSASYGWLRTNLRLLKALGYTITASF